MSGRSATRNDLAGLSFFGRTICGTRAVHSVHAVWDVCDNGVFVGVRGMGMKGKDRGFHVLTSALAFGLCVVVSWCCGSGRWRGEGELSQGQPLPLPQLAHYKSSLRTFALRASSYPTSPLAAANISFTPLSPVSLNIRVSLHAFPPCSPIRPGGPPSHPSAVDPSPSPSPSPALQHVRRPPPRLAHPRHPRKLTPTHQHRPPCGADLFPLCRMQAFSSSAAASDVSRLTLVGRLGTTPEVRQTKNGKDFLIYKVATRDPYRAPVEGG